MRKIELKVSPHTEECTHYKIEYRRKCFYKWFLPWKRLREFTDIGGIDKDKTVLFKSFEDAVYLAKYIKKNPSFIKEKDNIRNTLYNNALAIRKERNKTIII